MKSFRRIGPSGREGFFIAMLSRETGLTLIRRNLKDNLCGQDQQSIELFRKFQPIMVTLTVLAYDFVAP